MLSSMFHDKKLSPSESVEATVKGSVEDISSQEKIKRLAAELGRELDRSGDSQIRRQVMRMISNTELCSRRGHLNASFISDEGNVSGSETSSVLQTEAVIENYQLPEITEEIAREDDTLTQSQLSRRQTSVSNFILNIRWQMSRVRLRWSKSQATHDTSRSVEYCFNC